MKLKLIPVLTFGILAVGLGSCKDTCSKERIYDANVPVYLSFEELRQPVTVTASQTLEHPGKFWRKDNYLFVSDINKGIHVYNIGNAAAPYEMAFVNVPGVVDVAVKDNYLLADSYTDLLVLDISNPGQPAQVKRLNDVFSYNALKVQPKEGYPVVQPDQTKGVVTAWKIEKVKDEYGCDGGPSIFLGNGVAETFGGIMSASPGGGPAVFSGGGSMAAFAVKGDYLYSVDNSNLRAYSIADPMNPSLTSNLPIGWNIETIVAYERYLFIGTRSGLQIFGIQNAASPNYISGFTHATACDPVIVQDDIAYVTLREKSILFEQTELARLPHHEDQNVHAAISAGELIQVIQNLPPGYRAVFNLFVMEEFSHEEIAVRLGISVGTSKSQLARARQLLKEKITVLHAEAKPQINQQ